MVVLDLETGSTGLAETVAVGVGELKMGLVAETLDLVKDSDQLR
jgi:hypothetical protein